MKKLSKLVLRELDVTENEILKNSQMKYLIGGYGDEPYFGDYYGDGCTNFECDCEGGGGFCTCVNDAASLLALVDNNCPKGGSCHPY
jgi:hypothetical protein